MLLALCITIATITASAAECSDSTTSLAERNTIASNISQQAKEICTNNLFESNHALLNARDEYENFAEIIRNEHQKYGWKEDSTIPNDSSEVYNYVVRYIDPKAIRLAYMDYDKASEILKEYILSARREIIYRFSWRADSTKESAGYCFISNVNDRTFAIPPRFSDLFPEWFEPELDMVLPDWAEAPIEGVTDNNTNESSIPVEPVLTSVGSEPAVMYATPTVWYNSYTRIDRPSTTVNTSPFYQFAASTQSTTEISVEATAFITSTSYNLGVTNLNTNQSEASWLRKGIGDVMTFSKFLDTGDSAITYGLRASTFSTPGSVKIKVTGTRWFA